MASDPQTLDAGEYGLPVSMIPSADCSVTTVNPEATLSLAYTLMVRHNYSQIPVAETDYKVNGVVTWKSIGSTLLRAPDCTLKDCIVDVKTVRPNEDILEVAKFILQDEFVLVQDKGRLSGIITTADLTVFVESRARAFLVLGEIDARLRDLVRTRMDWEQVERLCDQDSSRDDFNDWDDLSIGDYQRVLENRDCWERLGWRMDRTEVVDLVGDVRTIRNDVMHFNERANASNRVEEIYEEQQRVLEGLVRILRTNVQG